MKDINEILEQQNELIKQYSNKFIVDSNKIRLLDVITNMTDEEKVEAFKKGAKSTLITKEFNVDNFVNSYLTGSDIFNKTIIKEYLDFNKNLTDSVIDVVVHLEKANEQLLDFRHIDFLNIIYEHRKESFERFFSKCLLNIKSDLLNVCSKFYDSTVINDATVYDLIRINVEENKTTFAQKIIELGNELTQEGIDLDGIDKQEKISKGKLVAKNIGKAFTNNIFKNRESNQLRKRNEAMIKSLTDYFNSFNNTLLNYYIMSVKCNDYILNKNPRAMIQDENSLSTQMNNFIYVQINKLEILFDESNEKNLTGKIFETKNMVKENELILKTMKESLQVFEKVLSHYDVEQIETELKEFFNIEGE